jgi:hypothetical protein
MFEQFITSIDYPKLIKMQANRIAPFERAVEIKKISNSEVVTKVKTKVRFHRK